MLALDRGQLVLFVCERALEKAQLTAASSSLLQAAARPGKAVRCISQAVHPMT
jgi:hypothetical protein